MLDAPRIPSRMLRSMVHAVPCGTRSKHHSAREAATAMEGEVRSASTLRQRGELLLIPFTEEDLHREDLARLVPVHIELVVILVDLHVRHLERYGLVGLASQEKILELRIRRLDLLLVSGHESVPRLGLIRNLRVLHFEQ